MNELEKVAVFRPGKGAARAKIPSLRLLGAAYLLACIGQAGWLVFIGVNRELAWQIASIPLFGWAFGAMWALMALFTPMLCLIGIKILILASDPTAAVMQTPHQHQKMRFIMILMGIGTALDAGMLFIGVNYADAEQMLFLSALIGGRVAQANLEAVLHYYNL